MEDVNNPEIIEVLISEDGRTLWINTGYECILRACKIKQLLLSDNRKKPLPVIVDPPDKVG